MKRVLPGRMRGAIRRSAALAAVAALVAVPRAAGQGFDREVAFLTIPTGARVVGMGRAASALPGEFQSARWNPAVVGAIDEVAPLLSHYDGPLDFRSDQLAIAVPTGGLGVLALSIELQSFGEIPLFEDASPDIQSGVVSPSNLVVGLTFARSVFGGLAVGLSGKWVRSELIAEVSGDTYALDAGAHWHPAAALPLDLGLSVTNLGPGLRVGNEPGVRRDPLPSRVRLGAAYDVLAHLRPAGGVGLLIAADLEHAWRDLAAASQYVGVELSLRRAVFIRGGYIAETLFDTNDGWTVGAGLMLGALRFDLARELEVNRLGDETHVSLSARL